MISCLPHAVGDQTAMWVCDLTGNWTHDPSVHRTMFLTNKPCWLRLRIDGDFYGNCLFLFCHFTTSRLTCQAPKIKGLEIVRTHSNIDKDSYNRLFPDFRFQLNVPLHQPYFHWTLQEKINSWFDEPSLYLFWWHCSYSL